MLNGKPSKNKDDTYILCRGGHHIYRLDKNNLVLMLVSSNAKNKVVTELIDLGVKLKNEIDGDFEGTYIFPSSQLDIVAQHLKAQTKGKNKYPNYE